VAAYSAGTSDRAVAIQLPISAGFRRPIPLGVLEHFAIQLSALAEESIWEAPVCDRLHSFLNERSVIYLSDFEGKRPPSDVPYLGGSAMWDLDSYRDFLDEHKSQHHTIGSALIVLVVVGVLLAVFG